MVETSCTRRKMRLAFAAVAIAAACLQAANAVMPYTVRATARRAVLRGAGQLRGTREGRI